MISVRSTSKRVLAAGLPVFLVWAFVACVSLCSLEDKEGDAVTLAEISVSHEDEHCPVTEVASSELPERHVKIPCAGEGDHISSAAPIQLESYTLQLSSTHNFTSPSSLDPPFRLIRTLRI
jgi:hypothetical protein